MRAKQWNHNIHYQRLILERIPPHARRALDVGCGEGILTRELNDRISHMVGIDRHEPSIATARTQSMPDIDYVLADVLDYHAEPFDLIASVAALHHIDTAAGLTKLAGLLVPGGRLVVIGCAKRSLPHDLPWEIAGAIETRVLAFGRGHWHHSAPARDPQLTHAQTRHIATAVLPGARYRQLAMWRYLLDWTKL